MRIVTRNFFMYFFFFLSYRNAAVALLIVGFERFTRGVCVRARARARVVY